MLDGLKRKMAGAAISNMLRSLATSKDTHTTITGLIAAAVLAIPGLDIAKLIAGDPQQIAHLVSGLLVFVIGLSATRENRNGATTLIGVIAGALRASAGDVTAITEGVTIAVLGHLTNQPTVPKSNGKPTAALPDPNDNKD